MPNTDLMLAVVGAALLVGSILPRLLRERVLSAPIVVVGVGMLIGWLMPSESKLVDVIEHAELAERMAEVTVIVALFGVGLALDRPLTFRGWSTTWRLLVIGMPLSIAGVAVLGWWALGVTPAVAILLGAVLASTDPVLASDVQVEGPGHGEGEKVDDEHDEARFALTSESGLNDALAFPFVYLAIFLATRGPLSEWGWSWAAWDLVGKTVIGAVAGWIIGRLVGAGLYRVRIGEHRLVGYAEPAAAVATLLLAYGIGELVGGWGFLAVFCAALGVRAAERHDEKHARAHEFIEFTEHLLRHGLLLEGRRLVTLARGVAGDRRVHRPPRCGGVPGHESAHALPPEEADDLRPTVGVSEAPTRRCRASARGPRPAAACSPDRRS